MASVNPFAALDPDYEPEPSPATGSPPGQAGRSSSRAGSQGGVRKTSYPEELPRLTSDQGPPLYDRLLKWWRGAIAERYVAHYYPQHSGLPDLPRAYHLPLLLNFHRPQPALIRHYDLEVDLLPLTVADDQYLLTSKLNEAGSWLSLVRDGRGGARKDWTSVKWRRLLYERLGKFPLRSTTQYKTLLNTIDELGLDLGREFTNAKLLDTRPDYGHLYLAAAASQLRYRGLQPNDAKRAVIRRLWTMVRERDETAPEPQLDETTILETSLPVNEYQIIYYEPQVEDDGQWPTTVERELEVLWPTLAEGGFLLVLLPDRRTVNAAARVNRFLERGLYRSTYHGAIGLQGHGDTKATPIWVWSRAPIESS